MANKLYINGTVTSGFPDPAWCQWDPDPPAQRTHSGAAQSQDMVGVTYHFFPMTFVQGSALSALIDTLGGKISSLTAIKRDAPDAATWGTFSAFDGRGMWPERPHMVASPGHLLYESAGSQDGPTWHVAFVAPAKV